MIRSFVTIALIVAAGCLSYPVTFPDREGPGTSPMLGGVSCHSTGEHVMACTSWDGHHVLSLDGGFGPHYSDLGASWGQRSNLWHAISNDAAASWHEDRRDDAAPAQRCPDTEEQWWTRGDWASQRARFEAYEATKQARQGAHQP